MIRHVVAWNFNDDLSEQQRRTAATRFIAELEALPSVVPGLQSLRVFVNPLPTSTHQILLVSVHDDLAAFNGYLQHQAHHVAAQFLKTVVKDRVAFDHEF
jgi:heme-degrading monooxygenase HmoA